LSTSEKRCGKVDSLDIDNSRVFNNVRAASGFSKSKAISKARVRYRKAGSPAKKGRVHREADEDM
jgi:hypothetical protein